MKKTYLILCILGVFLPYYNLINFLKINDWSMNGFFELLFSNYAVSMISMDLSVAASTFLIFIIAKFWKKPKRSSSATLFRGQMCLGYRPRS